MAVYTHTTSVVIQLHKLLALYSEDNEQAARRY